MVETVPPLASKRDMSSQDRSQTGRDLLRQLQREYAQKTQQEQHVQNIQTRSLEVEDSPNEMEIVINLDGNAELDEEDKDEEEEADGGGSSDSAPGQLTPLTTITPVVLGGHPQNDNETTPVVATAHADTDHASCMHRQLALNSEGKENVLSYVEIKEEPLDSNYEGKDGGQVGKPNERPLDLHLGPLFDVSSAGRNPNMPDIGQPQNEEQNQMFNLQFSPTILAQIQNITPIPAHPNDGNNGGLENPNQNRRMLNDGNIGDQENQGQNTGMLFSAVVSFTAVFDAKGS